MLIADVLKNMRQRADQRQLVDLVSGMTDGQIDDLGLDGLCDARRRNEARRFVDAAGWGPWRLG